MEVYHGLCSCKAICCHHQSAACPGQRPHSRSHSQKKRPGSCEQSPLESHCPQTLHKRERKGKETLEQGRKATQHSSWFLVPSWPFRIDLIHKSNKVTPLLKTIPWFPIPERIKARLLSIQVPSWTAPGPPHHPQPLGALFSSSYQTTCKPTMLLLASGNLHILFLLPGMPFSLAFLVNSIFKCHLFREDFPKAPHPSR